MVSISDLLLSDVFVSASRICAFSAIHRLQIESLFYENSMVMVELGAGCLHR